MRSSKSVKFYLFASQVLPGRQCQPVSMPMCLCLSLFPDVINLQKKTATSKHNKHQEDLMELCLTVPCQFSFDGDWFSEEVGLLFDARRNRYYIACNLSILTVKSKFSETHWYACKVLLGDACLELKKKIYPSQCKNWNLTHKIIKSDDWLFI